MHWSEVWHGQGLGPTLARAALVPLSGIYWLAWESYAATYAAGLRRPKEPHRPVFCVGNLVVGGSGKTPFTLCVAREIETLGWEVVVSCSGYGSPASANARIAPEGELDAAEWGDEPAMIRWLAPKVPLAVGRDRVRAAELVAERFPGSVMLMDDGFQHLPLRKHVSIVLEPGGRNRLCLPAGPYREPRRHLARADLVLPNGFRLAVSSKGFLSLASGRVEETLDGPAQALCALGSPAAFLESVRRSRTDLVATRTLPDHDRLDAGNLFEGLDPNLPLVVTAKDWVKLRRRADIGDWDVRVALHEVRAEPQEGFRTWLASRLDGIANEPPAR